ncbi:glycosyltransferase [Alphaproteobacteria bacterium]|nr:glycosyltransferase [Alphaproteobacteria bacterium]
MKNKYLVIFMPSIEGGGVEKNLFIIANYLSSIDNNIKLITASKGFDQKFKNIDVIKPKLSFLKNTSRKFKYLICLLELLKLILSGKNISVFSFQANLYCIILCKIFKIKVIIRSNSSPTGWSKNSLKKFIFKYLLGLADKVIVNSIDFKKQFKVLFNINAKCIYNPLNKSEILKYSKEPIKFPFYKKNKKSLRIITIGRFTAQKDHLTLLRSLNQIQYKIDFKLLIIGRGVNKYKMINYIKDNNLINKVKILPFQNNPFKYLMISDLFILTSKFEGLPNVLLEAAVLKKFIISTNCPTGPREILQNGKGGFLFKIGDYKNLSQKILNYHQNKKKLKGKINHNYKNLIRFDINKNLQKYYTEIKKHTH